MNNQIIKTILFGALLGAALFAAPFFALKVLLFFMIIGLFFRIFRARGYYHRRGWNYSGWAYADKIRQMPEQEYQEFKNKYQQGCWPEDSVKKEETDSQDQKVQ